MAPIPNPRLLLAARPTGFPVPDKDFKYDTSQSIDLESVPLHGGFLTKTLYASVDPYFRNLMRAGWEVGGVIGGFALSQVLRSEMAGFKKGDILYGTQNFQAYTLYPSPLPVNPLGALRILKNEERLPLSVYLGIAGMPGKTAYYGLKAIAEPKAGESIFISAASGPVGQIVCQICKAAGLRVLGSAGSDEKVRFIKEELGADQVFNYKTASTADELKKFGGIDIYWDNVGGETLEAALDAMNRLGRIVVCGHVSVLNTPRAERPGVKNTESFIPKELRMQGLYVNSYEDKYADDFYATVPKMIADGKLKYVEEVTEGLDKLPQVLLNVLKGDHLGKAVIKL